MLSSPVEESATKLEMLMMEMAWSEYRRFSRALSIHKLTFPQFHTLVAIKQNNFKCTMGLLALETKQVSATMTGIIDRLVSYGLVERWRPPKDRRKVLVRLTEAGQLKLDRVLEARQRYLSTVLGQLDETTRHNLTFSLKQYLEVVEVVS